MKRRFTALLICLCMTLSLCPAVSFADTSAASAGLYWRWPIISWENNQQTITSDPDAELMRSFTVEPYWYPIVEFVFQDENGNLTTVSFNELSVSGDSFVIEPIQDDFVVLTWNDFGTGAISYNGYSISVESVLPAVGFYDEPAVSQEHFLKVWNYWSSMETDNMTVYLVADSGYSITEITAQYGDVDNTVISPDGKYATVRMGFHGYREMFAELHYIAADVNGYSEEMASRIDIVDGYIPMLYCRSAFVHPGNTNQWEVEPSTAYIYPDDLTHVRFTSPDLFYPQIMEFFFQDENGDLTPVRWDELNVFGDFFTIGPIPDDYIAASPDDYVAINCYGFGTGSISYNGYSVFLESDIPPVWFYGEPVASQEHYLGEWNYDGTNDTIYLVSNTEDTITKITDIWGCNCDVTIDSSGRYATFKLLEVNANRLEVNAILANDNSTHWAGIKIHESTVPVLRATAGENDVFISWNAVPNATKYAIYRKSNEGGSWGNWAILNKAVKDTNYTDTNVVLGGKYQYRAKAYINEAWGEYSSNVEVMMPLPEPPAAPVIEVETVEGQNIISWGAVPGTTEYILSRRVSEAGSWGDWMTISTQSETSYIDTLVTPGWKCEYRVKVRGIGGTSGYSNRVIVTALAPQPPAAPEIEVMADAERVTVRWGAVTGSAKYQVYRREKANGKWSSWTLVFSAKPTIFYDTNVTGGVVYEYRVKSVKTLSDGSSLKSGYSNREMVGLTKPDAPVITVTPASGKNTVSWKAVTGADYYVVYWRDKSSGDWSAWTSSDQVTGLSYNHIGVQKGVEYQYRIRASNGVWSEYSNRVVVTAK